MPASKSSSSYGGSGGQAPTPPGDAHGSDARLATELIGALRALQPGPGEVTSFQQAIIEEHAELKRALRGPHLVSAGPVIASLSPERGQVGTQLVISGERLGDATRVWIGSGRATTFVDLKPAAITLKVPEGATAGEVTVFTPLGVAASAKRFEVTSARAA